MSRRVTARGRAWPVLALAWVLVAAGCRDSASLARYTVRGAIENLSESGGRSVVLIHHEAIPDFVDGYGEKRTMHSMAMAFGIEDGVSMDGVAVGDKVEVTFVVDREHYPSFLITTLRELPASTELALSR